MITKTPHRIARLIPTYLLFKPTIQVSIGGAGLMDISSELMVLMAIIGIMVEILVYIIENQKKEIALIA